MAVLDPVVIHTQRRLGCVLSDVLESLLEVGAIEDPERGRQPARFGRLPTRGSTDQRARPMAGQDGSLLPGTIQPAQCAGQTEALSRTRTSVGSATEPVERRWQCPEGKGRLGGLICRAGEEQPQGR